MKEEKCEHKWLPNGIINQEEWGGHGTNYPPYKIGESVFASCICEKCGEIKIKEI